MEGSKELSKEARKNGLSRLRRGLRETGRVLTSKIAVGVFGREERRPRLIER